MNMKMKLILMIYLIEVDYEYLHIVDMNNFEIQDIAFENFLFQNQFMKINKHMLTNPYLLLTLI